MHSKDLRHDYTSGFPPLRSIPLRQFRKASASPTKISRAWLVRPAVDKKSLPVRGRNPSKAIPLFSQSITKPQCVEFMVVLEMVVKFESDLFGSRGFLIGNILLQHIIFCPFDVEFQ
jgi:hypothetical protein